VNVIFFAWCFSSSNAKKWEQDMQILRNNNARLTSALQESNTNVEEWKVQLATYKEENSRMKAKVRTSHFMFCSFVNFINLVIATSLVNEINRS